MLDNLGLADYGDGGSLVLFLAQDGAGPPAGEAGAAGPVGDSATGAQPGAVGVPDGASLPPTSGAGGNATPTGSPFAGMMPIFIGFIVLLFFVSVLGPRREKKKREAMMSSLNKHDRVQTIGGVVGAIVEIKPDYVVLKVDESSNTRITFARTAIQQVLDAASAGDSGN